GGFAAHTTTCEYFGYFLTVVILVFGTVGTWIAVTLLKEKSIIRKLAFLKGHPPEEGERSS
ncbi:MAG: hypothetical protein ACE5GH_06410, partial [Fidelibacterota bacterium]